MVAVKRYDISLDAQPLSPVKTPGVGLFRRGERVGVARGLALVQMVESLLVGLELLVRGASVASACGEESSFTAGRVADSRPQSKSGARPWAS